jgi:hypothetical protein
MMYADPWADEGAATPWSESPDNPWRTQARSYRPAGGELGRYGVSKTLVDSVVRSPALVDALTNDPSLIDTVMQNDSLAKFIADSPDLIETMSEHPGIIDKIVSGVNNPENAKATKMAVLSSFVDSVGKDDDSKTKISLKLGQGIDDENIAIDMLVKGDKDMVDSQMFDLAIASGVESATPSFRIS